MPTLNLYTGDTDDTGYVLNSIYINSNYRTYVQYHASVYYNTAIRFVNATIPNGATITNASFKTLVSAISSSCEVRFEGDKSTENPSQIVDDEDFEGRARTTANSSQTYTETGTIQTNVTSIIQEICSQTSWSSGNAIVLFVMGVDNTINSKVDLNNDSTSYYQLDITYILEHESNTSISANTLNAIKVKKIVSTNLSNNITKDNDIYSIKNTNTTINSTVVKNIKHYITNAFNFAVLKASKALKYIANNVSTSNSNTKIIKHIETTDCNYLSILKNDLKISVNALYTVSSNNISATRKSITTNFNILATSYQALKYFVILSANTIISHVNNKNINKNINNTVNYTVYKIANIYKVLTNTININSTSNKLIDKIINANLVNNNNIIKIIIITRSLAVSFLNTCISAIHKSITQANYNIVSKVNKNALKECIANIAYNTNNIKYVYKIVNSIIKYSVNNIKNITTTKLTSFYSSSDIIKKAKKVFNSIFNINTINVKFIIAIRSINIIISTNLVKLINKIINTIINMSNSNVKKITTIKITSFYNSNDVIKKAKKIISNLFSVNTSNVKFIIAIRSINIIISTNLVKLINKIINTIINMSNSNVKKIYIILNTAITSTISILRFIKKYIYSVYYLLSNQNMSINKFIDIVNINISNNFTKLTNKIVSTNLIDNISMSRFVKKILSINFDIATYVINFLYDYIQNNSIRNLVIRRSKKMTVYIPDESNKYNQNNYTKMVINGRIIKTVEETIGSNGEKLLSNAKLFTVHKLSIGCKIDTYKIISVKKCKDNKSNIQFYKYLLKGNKKSGR